MLAKAGATKGMSAKGARRQGESVGHRRTLRALEIALVAAHHARLQRDEQRLLPSNRAQKRNVEIALFEQSGSKSAPRT